MEMSFPAEASHKEFFTALGPLKKILPNYIPREQPRQMADAVAAGLKDGRNVLVEAGTGVGKSLAYLIPSALWAIRNEKKVVVATFTKALQEQLVSKDLPFVHAALKKKGLDLKFALLMGSENYLCLQRFHRAMGGGLYLLASPNSETALKTLSEWFDKAATGLRKDLPCGVPNELWESINRDPDICLGKRGRCWESCLYRKDTARALKADIIVVNQHLLLAGLPKWLKSGAIIVDEAHNLQKVASQTLGITLSPQKLKRLLDDTYNVKTRVPLLGRSFVASKLRSKPALLRRSCG